MNRRVVVLLVTLAAAFSLSACRPLYVPLVPDDAPVPVARTSLAAESSLSVDAGRPILTVVIKTIAPAAEGGDWLAVQWFGPSGALAASESRWIDASSVGSAITFELPADVVTAQGEWRVIVSLGGSVLRQFRVDVSTDPEA